jgi:hypothetical protein
MEVGVGTVCRKLDNALLAKSFPADPVAALSTALKIDRNALPEKVAPTYDEVLIALASNESPDWRVTVKRIEWLISWNLAGTVPLLVQMIRQLGYYGLAALVDGDASTGAATVWYDSGRLYLVGPKNAQGRAEFKKLPKWRFHPAGQLGTDSKPAWSCLATADYSAFAKTVLTYWPNVTGLEEALEGAKNAVTTAVITGKPVAAVVSKIDNLGNGWLKVKTPFNKEFVDTLKAKLPPGARKWNPVEKVWEVKAEFETDVTSLVNKVFAAA